MNIVPAIDPTTLDRLVASLRRSAQQRGSRGLLLLSSDRLVSDSGLMRWARQRRMARLVTAARPVTDASDRLLGILGRENDDLFWSAPATVRPSEVAAVLGTVTAGSLAIVWLPPSALQRSALLGRLWHATARTGATFDARSTCAVARLGAHAGWRTGRLHVIPQVRVHANAMPARRSRDARLATRQQDTLLRRALEQLNSSATACLVLVGPRGTGKSRLLGRIALALSSAQAPDRPDARIRIVSASGSPAASLLQASGVVPHITVQQALGGRDLTLLLDEAASLPLATLDALLERHGRIVFATTVDGYEATGRAFAVRFLGTLELLRPGWQRIDTRQRFRFRADDPVNRLVGDAFLLDVIDDDPVCTGSTSACTIEAPPPSTLQRHERLLRQIVALLAGNHYRNALDDLDAMLSGRLLTLVARDGDRVIGVAIVAHEGCMPASLGEPVLAGSRRLPDQLLPQRLARCANDARALGEHYRRVTRIAVAADRRLEGVAGQLVQHLVQTSGPDVAIGASYGRGDIADRFWASLGAGIFHDGVRVNPRSGEQSRAVLLGGSAVTRHVLQQAIAIHQDNSAPSRASSDPGRDAALLQRFASGQRRWRDCRGALTRSWAASVPAGAPTLEQSRTFLALPEDAGERRWERALIDWVRRHLPPSAAGTT